MIREFGRDLSREFKGYNAGKLGKDVMAGLTVTAVALPLALAFGVSSGADAASGLITAIVAGLVMSLLSGGYYQISGPTGAMAAILVSLVNQYGMQGVFLATLLAGGLLLLAGIFKLGKLTAFIPMPVITGFTSGIAVIIALGQVDNFFGVTSQGASAITKLASYGALGFSPNGAALAIGLAVVLLMALYPKKWGAVVPGSLVAIILATAAAAVLKLEVQTVGAIPQTLLPETRLRLGDIRLEQLMGVAGPAVSIALLGMIESLLCGASAGRMTGVKLRSDQELIAQGAGNLLIPFFGGIPATAAIARTSVAIKSGAQTRLTGVIHGLGLMASMLLLAPVMSQIPLSALAGVLMVTAWRMNEWGTIRTIFKGRFKGPMVKFLATMAATIVFDLTIAILVGVGLALIFLVARLSKLEVAYEKVDTSRLGQADPAAAQCWGHTVVAYVTGPILFANTQAVEDIAAHLQGADTLLLSMRGVSSLDLSGSQALLDTLQKLKSQGVALMCCGVAPRVLEMMKRTGIYDLVGEERFYWSATQALTQPGKV